MTEFISRKYGDEGYEVIIKTDNFEHFKASEEFARHLVDHAKPGVTIQRWIRATEEETPDKECIAVGFQGEMLIGWIIPDAYSDTGYSAESDGAILSNVTHWMPLPEPPVDI